MFVPAMTVAGPVLVTARSAWVLTVVVAVALLLPGVLSVVELVALAVLLKEAPLARLGLAWATIVKLAESPAASEAIVSLIAFPLLVRVKDGPVFWLCETNVVPAGSVSARVTLAAAPGPILVTVTV